MIDGIKEIGVVGAGAMGAGVAQTFAIAGYPVRLQDIAEAPLNRGMGAIKKSLERLVARGKLEPDAREATLHRIAPTIRIEDLADCDVVVEAVLERFEIKKEVFGVLDRVCRAEAILATNTSSISVTRIASTSKIRGRVIGMHFFNPVPIMALVEIIRALQTTDATCDGIVKLTEDLGKKARVSKDSYGFVVNRVLVPMINEAINCVYEGLATPRRRRPDDETRREPPHGTAIARRPHRPRHRPRHHGDPLHRFRRLEVPPESALEAGVRRGLPRPENR
jgi:3-hydroxybutyryl-CoA dehydrogenase